MKTTLATAFDPRRNSLNLLRVVFALAVILGHASLLAFGQQAPGLGSLNYRDPAVDGFFVISGFLITRSRIRSASTWSYLQKRFLRIYPGYWAALVVGAAVVGPIGWLHLHGSLHGYVETGPTPEAYVLTNLTIFVHQYAIGDVFVHAPKNMAVNGSLWTLFHEVLVYLLIAGVAALGLLKMRSRVMLGILAVYFFSLLWSAIDVESFKAVAHSPVLAVDGVRLGFMFVLGSLLFLWSERIPYDWRLAVASAAVLLASASIDQWRLLGGLPFAYLVIYLSIRLPFHGFGRRHDLSYGIYLYGWPAEQLMWMWGAQRLGLAFYVVASCLLAAGAAFLSWHFVESPALRWKPGTVTRTATSTADSLA